MKGSLDATWTILEYNKEEELSAPFSPSSTCVVSHFKQSPTEQAFDVVSHHFPSISYSNFQSRYLRAGH